MQADMCNSQANFCLEDEPFTDLFFGQSHEHESGRGMFNPRSSVGHPNLIRPRMLICLPDILSNVGYGSRSRRISFSVSFTGLYFLAIELR